MISSVLAWGKNEKHDSSGISFTGGCKYTRSIRSEILAYKNIHTLPHHGAFNAGLLQCFSVQRSKWISAIRIVLGSDMDESTGMTEDVSRQIVSCDQLLCLKMLLLEKKIETLQRCFTLILRSHWRGSDKIDKLIKYSRAAHIVKLFSLSRRASQTRP